jgi:outer membrane murein-binding lipoprotein Lpp
MRIHLPALVTVSGLLLTSCADPGKISSVEQKVVALETKLQALEKSKEALELKVNQLDFKASVAEDKEALLGCGDAGYALAPTDLGKLLLSCEDLKPFGDGFKATLTIGNPHQITFKGIEIKARYHPKWGTTPFEVREKTTAFTTNLWPGTWTKFSIVLSPAKAEDTGMIWITLKTNTLALRN